MFLDIPDSSAAWSMDPASDDPMNRLFRSRGIMPPARIHSTGTVEVSPTVLSFMGGKESKFKS
jgi:hypothetical protein